MRWPWQRRREQPRHAVGRPSASWAAPAFPPSVATAAALAVEPTPVLAAASAPTVDASTPATTVDVPVQGNGVMLGFADGSNVALDEGDPRAAALRAVADVLISRPNR